MRLMSGHIGRYLIKVQWLKSTTLTSFQHGNWVNKEHPVQNTCLIIGHIGNFVNLEQFIHETISTCGQGGSSIKFIKLEQSIKIAWPISTWSIRPFLTWSGWIHNIV